jgi:hypothetical protein
MLPILQRTALYVVCCDDDEVPADVPATRCFVAADVVVAAAASEINKVLLLRVDVSMCMLL